MPYDGFDIVKIIQPTHNKDYYNIKGEYVNYKILWEKEKD